MHTSRRRSPRLLSVTLLTVIALLGAAMGASAQGAGHYGRPGAPAPAPADPAPGGQQPSPVAAPSAPEIPAGAVRIAPDQDAEAVVHAHPAGTTFVFTSGVHRGVEIGVRSGDTYLGEPGAVLDGTVALDRAAFRAEGGRFVLDGFRTDTTTAERGSCAPWYEGGMARCGHEQEVLRSEMLLADGVRLRHVNTAAEVAPGSWHYDAAAGRITLAQLPQRIEVATADFAFAGWGTRAVTIAGLHLRSYASPAQMGAIDALGTSGWVVEGVAVTGSHGYGIRIGADMAVRGSLIADNGHLGIGGSAERTGFTATGNEIAGNGWLGVQPGFESGGLKALFTVGAVITDNWVHDNAAKGIWLDGYNRQATIARNVVERSGQTGILYEISYSAEIVDNVLRGNHTSGDTSESYGNLQVVDSRDVLVARNTIAGAGAQELTIYANGNEPGVANVTVRDNRITIDTAWQEGTYGVKDLRGDKSSPIQGLVFAGNELRIVHAPSNIFAWQSSLVSAEDWTRTHPDAVVR